MTQSLDWGSAFSLWKINIGPKAALVDPNFIKYILNIYFLRYFVNFLYEFLVLNRFRWGVMCWTVYIKNVR
jgi:hypothetical protein